MNFSQPQEYIITSTQPINLFLAGVGSGKTHLAGAISGYYIINFPQAWGFIGANTYKQLSDSTMFRIREVWKELFGWIEGRDYVVGKIPPKSFNTESHNFETYHGIVSFKDGAICFTGSLDNAKAHDGKEFAWAILDETKDSREDDVKEVILTRLRKEGIYITPDGALVNYVTEKSFCPLYILTSPAKVQWINDWFQLDEWQEDILRSIYSETEFYVKEWKDKCVIISSTYHNQHNLRQGYIQSVLDNNKPEAAKKLIYGNPFVRSGGEFYSGFDRMVHVQKVEFIPGLPIHISFDQNVVPYVTGTLYQVLELEGGKKQIRQFDEFCLENPNNKTAKICTEFIRKYGTRVQGLYYYGDPSGKKSDTRGSEHDYNIVDRLLRKYLNNRSNRVPVKHPPVIKRKDFANNIFEGVYADIEFVIDSKCKNSIADFEYLKEDMDGKKLKETAKDSMNRTYEKYGHTSDSFDYFITIILKHKFDRFVK